MAKQPKANEKEKEKDTISNAKSFSSLKALVYVLKNLPSKLLLELINKKLDLILNKLDDMQKVVDNLASRISKLEK